MPLKRFSRLYKSMFGQMALLTALLILSLIYFMALQPLLSNHSPFDKPDPLQFTYSSVREVFSAFTLQARTGNIDIEIIEEDPKIVALRNLNPDFSYHVKVAGKDFISGQPPGYYQKLKLEELTQLFERMALTNLCSNYSQPIVNKGTETGYVGYSYCSDFSYVEFAGITVPLEITYSRLLEHYPKWIWDSSRHFLYSAMGVFIIFVMMLLFNLVMIKRVAAVANSFDPENLAQKLPEEGLPNEVLPLVRAVNHMIGKVDETHKRHKFFLSTAAHEMRTPLTVLRTRLEMLEEGELKEKLINDVRRMVILVNQLLALMRVGAPKLPEALIDLVTCCEKVLNERQLIAQEKQVSLVFRTDKSSYWIPGDKGLLEVTIANLLDNALSFSEIGSTVDITLTKNGILSIRDHGPGIAPQHLSSLFEPFAKFPPNRNGYGLGLAIVKAVAELHSLEVTAHNMPDGGASFSIQFGPALPEPMA